MEEYVVERKITREEFERWYESMPKILRSNTYFWSAYGNSKYRRYLESKYMDDVVVWLSEIFSRNRIREDRDNNKIYLDDIRVFYIYISNRHFYKKQNLNYIKNQAKKLIF